MQSSTPDGSLTRLEAIGKLTVLQVAAAAKQRELEQLLAMRAQQQDDAAPLPAETLHRLETAVDAVAAANAEVDQYFALLERQPFLRQIMQPGYDR